MSLLKCVECESPVSNKAEACPNCGCPVAETVLKYTHKKQKTIYASIGAFLLVVAIAFVIIKVVSMPDRSGYYNGISWGSSSQKILAKLPTAELYDDKTAIISHDANFCGLDSISASVIYKLENDSLVCVTIYISNSDSSSYTENRIIEKICSEYDKQYGAHTLDEISAVWKTGKSEIKLFPLTESLILLTFKDNTLLENNDKSI